MKGKSHLSTINHSCLLSDFGLDVTGCLVLTLSRLPHPDELCLQSARQDKPLCEVL